MDQYNCQVCHKQFSLSPTTVYVYDTSVVVIGYFCIFYAAYKLIPFFLNRLFGNAPEINWLLLAVWVAIDFLGLVLAREKKVFKCSFCNATIDRV